jgi:hypothetical protein
MILVLPLEILSHNLVVANVATIRHSNEVEHQMACFLGQPDHERAEVLRVVRLYHVVEHLPNFPFNFRDVLTWLPQHREGFRGRLKHAVPPIRRQCQDFISVRFLSALLLDRELLDQLVSNEELLRRAYKSHGCGHNREALGHLLGE